MSFKSVTLAAVTALSFAAPALADGTIMIKDAYARSAGAMAKAGAAFMIIENHAHAEDRLISVSSDAAARVELHTHKDMGDGVMKMMEVEEGFAIESHGKHMLKRGGDHVMFMGLAEPWAHGDVVSVTLIFEKAGEIVIEVPVDLERKDAHGGMDQGHGAHKH